jgi:hypothetical protein
MIMYVTTLQFALYSAGRLIIRPTVYTMAWMLIFCCCDKKRREKKRKDSTGSDGTASMTKGCCNRYDALQLCNSLSLYSAVTN